MKEALLIHCKELKERGNRKLAGGDSAGALRLYSEALQEVESAESDEGYEGPELAELAAILHSNSAQALMKQRKWFEAIDRCHAALRFDPGHTKSSWRGATSAIEVGMHDVAVAFVEAGLEEDGTSQELLELRKRLGPLPDVDLQRVDSDDGSLSPSKWRLPLEEDKAAERARIPKKTHAGKEKDKQTHRRLRKTHGSTSIVVRLSEPFAKEETTIDLQAHGWFQDHAETASWRCKDVMSLDRVEDVPGHGKLENQCNR
eukprot:s2083_g21.t1